jgi:hypothetical protein
MPHVRERQPDDEGAPAPGDPEATSSSLDGQASEADSGGRVAPEKATGGGEPGEDSSLEGDVTA